MRLSIPRAMLAAVSMGVFLPACADAQVESHCIQAHAFLVENRDMAAVTEPFTLDDWRTDQSVPGCQVTAAGVTRRSARDEAIRFFDALREEGWVRTPDPQDAPGESSLRFRRDGSDCLFSFYTGGLLGTEAEATVTDARVPGPGERRYGFHVMCVPAMPAAPPPREGSASR
ncbi:MAG: hypothetical protein KY453_10185 [Gemmatimonadetes bacterium]|nr:hypothetical protein [Gemmatimonadota bacterium]